MDERIKRLVEQLKDHLIKRYGKKVRKVIVYGSLVRGEATRDSDIDVVVLVDEALNPFEVRESLSDLLFDMLLKEGELVSVIVLPERFFETHNYPFMLNVKRGGKCMREVRDLIKLRNF